jgi:hypothetical protein
MPWHPTLINSEILSVHAALVPVGSKGTVLMFGGDEHNSAQGGTDATPALPANVDRTALFDVNSRGVTRTSSPTTDVFCAGHAFMGDGRLLVVGGTESWGGADAGGPGGGHGHQHGNFGGHQACWVYNHHQNNWRRAADLGFKTGVREGGGRWYPSCLTLPSGDVATAGGHPSRRSNNWHENNLPERYSPASNVWGWYPTPISFEHPSLPGNWYPRLSLVRGGWIFFTTRHNNQCRFFDPNTGNLAGPAVAPPASPYNSGWDYSVIQLPLVPGDNYRSRILAVNGANPQKIELNLDAGAPTPSWGPAGTRQGSAAGKARTFSCPVYLPTGQVLVSGGINGVADTAAVKTPEIYTPDINWTTRAYNAGPGSWQTVEESAQIARNYHSVALLLPDGSVFTASSSKDANPGDPNVVGQKNIEIFFPAYFSNASRPSLVNAPPSLSYAQTDFTLTTGSTAQAASIRKVALVRCGSVTHSADFDQRYVALTFNQTDTANLRVAFPNDPSVVPPGHYMLWIVDQNDLPCQLARFVRVAHQGCVLITDRSTFSKEEVEALGNGGAATFENALYVQFDGFIHTELTGTPSFRVQWADTNADVPGGDFTLIAGPRLQEVTPGFADTPQRITFPFHVRFNNLNPYSTFADTRLLRVTFTLGSHTCTETLDLTHAPNPYMTDINAAENNPAWLSTDVRVFSIQAGQSKFGTVFQNMGDPIPFIRQCLDRLNSSGGDALFNGLSTSATLDLATNGPFPMMLPVFNYAIARVRYRAKTTTAQRVKCFFRMFNVAATGLEFDPNTTYRRTTVGPNTVPLLGSAGGEIVSIPFFASDRVETVLGQPGAISMTAQVLDPTYEMRDIEPNPSGAEVTAYFGCWLDINQTRPRIPITPTGSDGPWVPATARSIQELTRGRHMCVVSEVFFEPDPTQPGETPNSSDNLSQRNLAILHSDNPGGPDSHTVMHTFEVKPSVGPFGPQLLNLPAGALGQLAEPNFAIMGKRYRLDELLIRWHNLPKDSEVTIYFSDIDTRVIRALAAFRRSPLACEIVDQQTLRFTVAGATWVPLPGARLLNIPALLSVKLPAGVVAGQEFRISLHQVDGRLGRIIGACDFRIVVSSAGLILPEEIRTLSVFKHIATTIPPDNRWYPLILRYVHHLGVKVDALGGDSSGVHPNPDGSGRPYEPPTKQGPCFDPCQFLECLLRSKGVQEWLRKHGINPEEVWKCLKESCRPCGAGEQTARSLPLPDRLQSILGDEKLLHAVMQEMAREKDQL